MENNLKYTNVRSFYGSIRSFSMVSGDAKPSENKCNAFASFIALLRLQQSYQSEILSKYPFFAMK